MSEKLYDITIIGGGVVGTATAKTVLDARPHLKVAVIETHDRLAPHQTGHNSGVIHSGLYYKPGSLKARNCTSGREAMYRFCEENDIVHERCGKVVVATCEEEVPKLDELEKRGIANGLTGIRRLNQEELKQLEPHVSGIAGLFVAETGIVDYIKVTQAYGRHIQEKDGDIKFNTRMVGCIPEADRLVLETTQGPIQTRNLINCAGLQCDRVARMCGIKPGLQIVPFRGEYYEIKPERHHLVKNLIYPVPDPRFPFLGVHFTRMVGGGVEAGPNAVLAFKREGYRHRDISIRDMAQYASYGGFWRMAMKYWRMGMGEFYRSFSKGAFVRALQKLLPEITREDLVRGGSGVRAQALDPKGGLLDDFSIAEAKQMIHVLNAPSPAATASLSIGKYVAELAFKNFDLN